MNDDIIRMAREAKLLPEWLELCKKDEEALDRFVSLVRAAEREAHDKLGENYKLGLAASIRGVTIAMQKTTIRSLTEQRAELVRACRQALQAIEQGESFDHLDQVVAPALRRAMEGIDE